MRVPAVKAAVTLISTTIGNLPVKVYARDGEGKKPAPDHDAYVLAHDEANDWTSAGELRRQLTSDALLHGDAFAVATRRPDGSPLELIRLDPRAVEILTLDTGAPAYRYNHQGGQTIYQHADVLRISAPSIDGVTGLAPIKAAREAIATALVMEAHAGRIFKKGFRPSAVITHPGKLSDRAAERLAKFKGGEASGENAGGVAVLEENAKVDVLAFSSVDQEFKSLREFTVIEIARAFACPPVLLGDLSSATFKNAEELRTQFVIFTLAHWLGQWRDAYARVLLSPEERRSHVVDFVLDGLLQGDSEARAKIYQSLRAAGVMTANEVRTRENLPARSDGDELASPFTQSNAATGAQEAAA
ncbi:phage portal protein [Hansschlegelia zhihuaiae]|uniref:Phage portal protein n=2 Tax=Hansschlegelia zhihuaiae TaxID=405005 RepID=A0A4Q0M7Y0_9HYPH|nr:phage portal protein [Hansschlegelia zhihuaiae]